MSKDKGDAAKFCQSLDWYGIKFDWFDRTGMLRLDDGRLVKAELSTCGISGQYQGLKVTVLNKAEGKVDEKFFAFDDYLPAPDRTDGREKDYPVGPNSSCFQVTAHVGWKWYIAVPRTTRPFCDAIERWISFFQ